MESWQAILLGVIEGLTEFLPVSSTGHLLIAQRALGLEQSPAADAYAVCIQAGAIVAVAGLYLGRVRRMGLGLVGRDVPGRRLALNVLAAFLPAAAVGLALHDAIEARLYRPGPVAAALFAGGIAILAVDRYRRCGRAGRGPGLELEQLTLGGALAIGALQCAALWPGTSRSLATIVGGVLIGLRLSAAVEFSFLLGAVTLLAATAYKGLEEGPRMLAEYGWLGMAQGFVTAWIAAVLSVKWMVAYLGRHGLALFGWYRVLLALAVALYFGLL